MASLFSYKWTFWTVIRLIILTPCRSCLCNEWTFWKSHYRKTLKYICSPLFLVQKSYFSLILHVKLFHYTSHSSPCLHLSTFVHTFPKGRGSWCLTKFCISQQWHLSVIHSVFCPFKSDYLLSKIYKWIFNIFSWSWSPMEHGSAFKRSALWIERKQ